MESSVTNFVIHLDRNAVAQRRLCNEGSERGSIVLRITGRLLRGSLTVERDRLTELLPEALAIGSADRLAVCVFQFVGTVARRR